MALYTVGTGQPPAATDINQVINLLSGVTPQLLASVSVANRIRAQLTGATAASGFVGSTVNGPPTTGTFGLADLVVDTGYVCLWICTTAGTPGTWTRLGGGATAGDLLNIGDAQQQTLATRSGRVGFDVIQVSSVDTTFFTFPGASTTSYGYVIPSAGTYLFMGSLTLVGPTTGVDLGVLILKNGIPYQFGTQCLSYVVPTQNVTAQINCAVGDLIQLGGYAEGPYSLVSPSPAFVFLAAVFLAN